MNKLKRKDSIYRLNTKKTELKSILLKSIQSNMLLNSSIRLKSSDIISDFNKKKHRTRINTYCNKTVSKKTVNKKFKLSRTALLRLMRLGRIAGFRKAVW